MQKNVKNLFIGVLLVVVGVLIGYIINSNKQVGGPTKAKAGSRKIMTTTEIAESGGKATVFIVTRSKIGIELASGSGFIVSEDGKIVTNFHVIDNAYYASIKLSNGDVYDDVSIIDYDERRDIAVLKIKGLKLPTVKLGSAESINSGDRVVAIGSPVGLENTVSDGILSSKRNVEGLEILQTTAPISPGSSGGPLFNSTGEVIGITSAIFTGGQNLNFAVPVDYVKPLLDKETETELSKFQDEFIRKKWIGGKFDITKKVPFRKEKEERKFVQFGWFWVPKEDTPKRLKVVYLKLFSAAKEAGIKVGDEITEVNEIKVGDTEKWKHMFRSLQPGDVVTVKLLRRGVEKVFDVKPTLRPKATNAIEVIRYALDEERPVRLAIFVDEINFVGRIDAYRLEDWKRSIRSSTINFTQQSFSSFRNDKNFSIVDTGKIDVILNDLEDQYGAMLPQVRDGVLQSLGVTHLVSVNFSRYAQDRYSAWAVRWQRKFQDVTNLKTIDLSTGEVLCSDRFLAESDWNGKFKPAEFVDKEDEEHVKGMKLREKEIKSMQRKR